MNSELTTDDTEERSDFTIWWTYINAFVLEAFIEKTNQRRGRWWLDYFYQPNALSLFAGRWRVGLSWRLGYSLREARRWYYDKRFDVWARLRGDRFEL